MEELIRQVVKALREIWRRRWLGLGAAWIVAVIGIIAILRLPDKYEASARVYVDTESVLKPLMSGLTIQPDVAQRVSILSRTLISRPNIEKLIRMTDLDHTVKSDKDRDQLIDDLSKTLVIGADRTPNLYTISFRDPIPERARKTVQSLLSIFVESGLGDKRKDSETAKDFIDRQIREYEQKLLEAENRLKEFRLKNMAILSGGKDYFGKMEALTEDILRSRLELREAEQSREALKREIADQDTMDDSNAVDEMAAIDIQVPEMDARIQPLKQQLDEMLRRFTERHPDVITTKRLIAQLEEEKTKEIEARAKAAKATPGGKRANPLVQQLRVALAEAEGNVAALRARASEYESRYNALRAAANTVPEVESEAAQLNRDYDVIRSKYAELAQRREQASMTGELEEAGTMASFRVIDPPRVSQKPVAPNRLLMLPMIFLVALAAGAAVSFLISQVLPTFHDSRHLREIAKRPVLGTISMLETNFMKRGRRRQLYLFFGGLGGLAASFVMVIAALVVLRP